MSLRRKFLKSAISLIFPLVFCPFLLAQEEKLTISTFFPSPLGRYQELRAVKMAVGDTYQDITQYCWRESIMVDPVCNANHVLDPGTDLIVEGWVGINEYHPIYPLEIKVDSTGANIGAGIRLHNTDTTPAMPYSEYSPYITFGCSDPGCTDINRIEGRGYVFNFLDEADIGYPFRLSLAASHVPPTSSLFYSFMNGVLLLGTPLAATYNHRVSTVSGDGILRLKEQQVPPVYSPSYGKFYVAKEFNDIQNNIAHFMDAAGNDYALPKERLVRKPEDTQRITLSTDPSGVDDDPHLKFFVDNGQIWQFEIRAFLVHEQSADFKVRLRLPSNLTGLLSTTAFLHFEAFNGAGKFTSLLYREGANNYSNLFVQDSTGGPQPFPTTEAQIYIAGLVDNTNGTNGYLTFAWSPRAPSTNGLILHKGSYLIAKRLR
jgi:hypothetical protein